MVALIEKSHAPDSQPQSGQVLRNSQLQYTGESSGWNETGDYKERGGGLFRYIKMGKVGRWLKIGGG